MIAIREVSSREAWKIRGILFFTLIFAAMVSVFYPYDMIRFFFPGFFRYESSCLFLNLTGQPCPFCGMSHAFVSFIKLNFSESIYYNPSSVIFFTFSGFICLTIFVLSLFNRKIVFRPGRKLLAAIVILFCMIWLLNILYGHR